jgi:hypothetical protein
MKKIICKTDGAEILVDDEDYEVLSRFPWYRGGRCAHPMTFFYLRDDGSQTVYMHQILSGGKVMTDHIDGNVLNNQKSNLRAATKQQNSANARKAATRNGKPCSSKYKGVHFTAGKFRAVIGFNKKAIGLGSYTNEEDAARAYNAKAKELFGEYAKLNEINQHA